jgi:signal transduction histidine kinase/ligand-binding sensor domain-containing protein/ActR/RegA family two-component response regulator
LNVAIKHIISIILLFSFLSTSAQDKKLHFENFSTKKGLPHYIINHILEDHLGFLWFATNSGLFRFDGYNLKGYRHDIHDSTSISSPGVHAIVEDDFGQIWISTMYGVNLLDRRTGTFKRFLPYPSETGSKGKNIIRDLFVDQNNRLFALGNENLFLFDKKTNVFKMVNRVDDPNIKYEVKSIIEAENGTIWCAVIDGLLSIIPGDTLFNFIELKPGSTPGYNKGVDGILEAKDNKLWLSTLSGLALFDPDSGLLETDLLPLEFRTQRLFTFAKTKNGNLLLAFRNNGLGIYQSKYNFQHFEHNDEIFNSLHNNNVFCIREDQFGNIWLGTEGGISKISTDQSGFQLLQNRRGLDQRANNVTRIHEDQAGTIWMNTELGIYTKSKKEDLGHLIQINPEISTDAQASFIYEDAKESIWIAIINHGIWKKEKSASKFKEVPIAKELKNKIVYKIIGDNNDKNILWLGTTVGLYKLNSETFEFDLFQPLNQLSELKTDRVIVFAEFGDEIWLYYTYYNSIGRFDKKTEKFEIIRPPASKQYMLEGVFRDMIVSDDGKVWIATNFGLTQYDIKENTFKIFTKEDGLLDNDLTSLLIDDKNQVWVAGQEFIGKIEKDKNIFRCYDIGEKVKNFYPRARYVSENGELFFGCLNGVFTFHPDSIQADPVAPKIILTDFKVRDSTFLLDEAFEYTQNIVLSYDQNDISFEFSGIHYIDPSANKYKCYLEGYDKNWRDLGHEHHATYTNLNPGKFIFHLKSSNKDGVWNEEGLIINVLITPPFTQTNWFRAMIALILISLLYALYKNRQHQLALRRQKELAEQSAEYKTRFLADVSHEIRTPMNAIIGLSKLTLDTKLDQKQSKFITAIQESSQNLLTIINDLLDHTKLGSGKFTFVKKPFNLFKIVDQLKNTFTYKAEEKNLGFEISINSDIPKKLVGDPLRLNQILINLIGNALKFTQKGKVWLRIEKQHETNEEIQIRFEVGDTGIGIPTDKMESIFESFSQVENGVIKGIEGTGLGLNISKQLVEKQGGELFVESELEKGTRLWFDLAFEKANLKNKHVVQKGRSSTIDQLKILIVEDTYFNQMLVVEILKKHIKKVEITLAENGKIALEKLNRNSFDLILMDVKMPVMNGYEATKIIRTLEDEILRNIPILAVTASAIPEQLQKCKEAGMNDYVTKPIDENELIQKMYSLTQK